METPIWPTVWFSTLCPDWRDLYVVIVAIGPVAMGFAMKIGWCFTLQIGPNFLVCTIGFWNTPLEDIRRKYSIESLLLSRILGAECIQPGHPQAFFFRSWHSILDKHWEYGWSYWPQWPALCRSFGVFIFGLPKPRDLSENTVRKKIPWLVINFPGSQHSNSGVMSLT